MKERGLAVLAVAAVIWACKAGSFEDPFELQRVVGNLLSLNDDPPGLTVPDSAPAGAPFTATVYTTGGGCVLQSAGQDVSVSGLVAEIVPYDLLRRRRQGETLCSDVQKFFGRTVELVFTETGAATVRVRAATGEDSLSSIERQVRIY